MNKMNYDELYRQHKEELEKVRRERTLELTPGDLEQVAGGVGGYNEATCPTCGRPMDNIGDYDGSGDTWWECRHCQMKSTVTDGDLIDMINMFKDMGVEIVYPVWWDKYMKGKK